MQCRICRDTQHVALQLPAELIVLEHHVQRLVPRHIGELQRYNAADVRIEHHIQAADLGDQPEEVFEVVILEVEGDDLTGILGRRRGCGPGHLRRRLFERPSLESGDAG